MSFTEYESKHKGITDIEPEENNPLIEKLKKQFEDQGVKVLDEKDILKGIKELYHDKSVDEVIEEEIPKIQTVDPKFFIKNQINLSNVTKRLTEMYGNNPALKERYEDVIGSVSHSFKVWLRHIAFFMIDHPDKESLQETIDELKIILDGKWLPDEGTQHVINSEVIDINSIRIPKTFDVEESEYPLFESFESIEGVVQEALPFLKDSERRKVTMTVASFGEALQLRADKAKEIIERYLKEARDLVGNKEKPIPDYYDERSNIYEVIQRARNAYLV